METQTLLETIRILGAGTKYCHRESLLRTRNAPISGAQTRTVKHRGDSLTVFSLVLLNAYQVSLTSYLTTAHYYPDIDTVDQLAESGLEIAIYIPDRDIDFGSLLSTYDNEDKIAQKLLERIFFVPDIKSALDQVALNRTAGLYETGIPHKWYDDDIYELTLSAQNRAKICHDKCVRVRLYVLSGRLTEQVCAGVHRLASPETGDAAQPIKIVLIRHNLQKSQRKEAFTYNWGRIPVTFKLGDKRPPVSSQFLPLSLPLRRTGRRTAGEELRANHSVNRPSDDSPNDKPMSSSTQEICTKLDISEWVPSEQEPAFISAGVVTECFLIPGEGCLTRPHVVPEPSSTCKPSMNLGDGAPLFVH
uniref:Uncharacterized protein n=1 Tax=Timema bartmani TaxID=61472 RepID=A0A7R9F9C4_9NEOP|nr:unnamed protein product [Timema bartmani]